MEWNNLLNRERIRGNKSNNYEARSEFQKDYHRIIGSSAFRRLQDKTQVFPLEKSDFVRTRLTHSLEVSSIAKSLGQVVSIRLRIYKGSKLAPDQETDICDILLSAGLLHDIGNPPFGHFGEVVIQNWFEKNLSKLEYNGEALDKFMSEQMISDLKSFEGNAQTIRIITKLHTLIDINGMNLTKALLSTLMKYPCNSTEIKKSDAIIFKKMGYYYSEKETFLEIVQSTGCEGCRHPLTFLLEAADDISYLTADIEDATKKGLVNIDKIRHLAEEKLRNIEDNDAIKKYLVESMADLESYLQQSCGKANPELNALQNWIVSVQGRLINAAAYSFTYNYEQIMDGKFNADLFEGTHAELLVETLREVAYKFIFRNLEIQKLEIAAEKILGNLLDIFIPSVINFDTDNKLSSYSKKVLDLVSESHKHVYLQCSKGLDEQEKLYLRLMMITDYISGMTDSYAKNLYKELNGID
ncbi:deoxyguanosinetriphosphate triphosphohydrolase [Fusibacter sp. 3D3]|uniref:deoxyguanosinetriphosphate triphosphohydrolase n=1 Tax=Fusibacter sp. 3D3 TaxID=1048380 RepID=UPI000853D5FF|nr:deoxyguanosinetriphosphate triphosphohydrolase [Fusibacter sp. 3D3]GAU78664.1 deoxyguanosinetriphosphate triphosphohydrolase [Fusibacter sp. 3D3]